MAHSVFYHIHYLNVQLHALWYNTSKFMNSMMADIKSSNYDKSKYLHALVQFHHFVQDKKAQKCFNMVEDLLFAVSFNKPPVCLIGVQKVIPLISVLQISIVCQHEAALTLQIKEGHFRPHG